MIWLLTWSRRFGGCSFQTGHCRQAMMAQDMPSYLFVRSFASQNRPVNLFHAAGKYLPLAKHLPSQLIHHIRLLMADVQVFKKHRVYTHFAAG